jgi:glycosyltransferase involved in cell wall biosynthesis
MKKILFITKSEMMGGIEKVLLELVSSLNRTKYEVTVMTGEINDELKTNLPADVQYRSLFKKRFRGLDRILVHFPPSILHKIFVKNKYDVEISFQEGYPTKIISGANKDTKKVCWFHNDPYYYDFNLPFFRNKKVLKVNLESFDEIVSVSSFIAKGYKKYMNLNKEISVIYNSIDVQKVTELSKETINDLTIDEDVFRICYVGRLSEEKRVDMLVEGIISLKKLYKNIELIIIGDGHKFSEISNRVITEKAQGYIKLLGYKENPYPYIKSSSLLVCSSITESFCLVVAEALALGVPVLSTKCGGPEELLENGNIGMLVENNLDSLVLGIKEMVNNRDLYSKYKNINFRQSLNKYERNHIISQIESILGEETHEESSIV